MLVEEGAGWRVLDTTYDPATRTAVAAWPHFSRGLMGFFAPLADAGRAAFGAVRDGAGQAVEWSGEQLTSSSAGSKTRGADAGRVVASGVLGVLGGTLNNVTCPPAATDWQFRAEGTALLTGCSGPFEPDRDSWPARIGNRAPYPMLITLPDDVSGPGAAEMFTSMDLEDAAVSMLWSLTNRTVVPAGKSIELRLHAGAGNELRLASHTDYSTIAVRVVALATLAMSAGETLLVRDTVKAAIKALDDKVLESRRLDGTPYTLADAARDTAWDSELGRQLAATNPAFAVHIVNQAFAVLGTISCAISSVKVPVTGGNLDAALAPLFDSCFPAFVGATVTNMLGSVTDLADPRKREKLAAELVKGLIAEALNLRRAVTAVVAEPLSALLPGVDLASPELVARCSAAQCMTVPASPVSPVSTTEVYALLKAVDTQGPGLVTYDEIQWFWEPEATAACVADGYTPYPDQEWCNDYYYRNTNSRLRTAAFGPVSTIALNGTDGNPPPVPATLAQLAAQIDPDVDLIYRLRLADGLIADLTQEGY